MHIIKTYNSGHENSDCDEYGLTPSNEGSWEPAGEMYGGILVDGLQIVGAFQTPVHERPEFPVIYVEDPSSRFYTVEFWVSDPRYIEDIADFQAKIEEETVSDDPEFNKHYRSKWEALWREKFGVTLEEYWPQAMAEIAKGK